MRGVVFCKNDVFWKVFLNYFFLFPISGHSYSYLNISLACRYIDLPSLSYIVFFNQNEHEVNKKNQGNC